MDIIRRIMRSIKIGEDNARVLLGYLLVISGFIISIRNLMGFALVLLGLILVINPSEERMRHELRHVRDYASVVVEATGMLLISAGIAIVALSIFIFRDLTIISIGLGLLLVGLVIIPESSRGKLLRFIRNPLWVFEDRSRERETPEVKKKPKGFSKVKQKEYKKIPEDAIDPYTEERIHYLIAKGKTIIKCIDCGAYYDKDVWEYYGKRCVRIGCSNAEV